MATLLEAWVGPTARRTLLGLHPEVGLIADATAALIEAQDAGKLDRGGLIRAALVTKAFRKGLGYIQETDKTLAITERCALNLVKRSVRDASLVLPWPGNPDGGGATVRLTRPALEALARLTDYDYYRGTSSYTGNVVADLRAIATGLRVVPV